MIVMMMMNMLELMRLGLGASLAAVPRTGQARHAHVVFHRTWPVGWVEGWKGRTIPGLWLLGVPGAVRGKEKADGEAPKGENERHPSLCFD